MLSNERITTELSELLYTPTSDEQVKINAKYIMTIKNGQVIFKDSPVIKEQRKKADKQKLQNETTNLKDIIKFLIEYV